MVDQLVQKMGRKIHLVDYWVIEMGKVRMEHCLDPHLGLHLAHH